MVKYNIRIIPAIYALLHFIQIIKCSFLVFPLKSLKKKNMDLPFSDSSISKYLDKDFSPNNFVEDWYLRTITTELSVGTPSKYYITDILTNISSLQCDILDRYQEENTQNIFNISKTYVNTSNVGVYKSKDKITISAYFNEYFHLKYSNDLSTNTLFEKDVLFNFFLRASYIDPNVTSEKDVNYKELDKTTSFILGIQVATEYEINKTSNMLQSLKSIDAIDSYDFTFEFYNDKKVDPNSEYDEIGRLVFGKFDQIYDKKKYPDKNLRITKLLNEYSTIEYLIYISEMYMEVKGDDRRIPVSSQEQVEFVFDTSLINGVHYYKEQIKKEFFDKYEDGKMCELKSADGVDRSRENVFEIYVCDKDLIKKHKDDFPVLKFYSKDFNFTFEFDYDDLFREYIDNKVYFLVVFPRYKYKYRNWEFGKIFLKKYQLFFNVDSKLVKFYHEYEEPSSKDSNVAVTVLKIFCEFVVVIIMVFAAYYFGKILNKKRKLRAHELEDSYEYLSDKKTNVNNIELKN